MNDGGAPLLIATAKSAFLRRRFIVRLTFSNVMHCITTTQEMAKTTGISRHVIVVDICCYKYDYVALVSEKYKIHSSNL